MTSTVFALIAFAFVGLIAILIIVGMYNSLVTLRNRFKNAFSQIDVQLKRRYDLIPNLVETAKGYLSHERGTLEAVTQARNVAASAAQAASADPANASAMKDLMGAEAALGGALSKLMVTVEAYPDLKGNQNMLSLQEELTSTEIKIAFSRQAFNDAVTSFNTKRETFPTNLIAGIFNFAEAALFEITNVEERENVKVSFD